jgi:hypothetical protein
MKNVAVTTTKIASSDCRKRETMKRNMSQTLSATASAL